MSVVDITHHDMIPIPKRLPFLESLCWQKQGEDVYQLTAVEMLSRYERGWRYKGILGNPDGQELEFLKQLAKRHHSFLEAELCYGI